MPLIIIVINIQSLFRGTVLELGVRQMTQLKCIYTNAHSMGNKQEELEAIVQQANYDLVAMGLHDWSVVMDGCKLSRRDR